LAEHKFLSALPRPPAGPYANELHTLPDLGVYSISLHYRDDRHFFDQYGNWFHYQAALNPDPKDGESKDGRVIYDVFLVAAQNRPPKGDMLFDRLFLDGLDPGIYRSTRVRRLSPCERKILGGGQ
jgi:hypothetical protein